MKLFKKFKRKFLKFPNSAISSKEREFTYREFLLAAENFSEKIKNFRCAAILCSDEAFAAMAFVSCLAAGVTAVPLSERYGEDYCKKIIEFVNPDAVISDENGMLAVKKTNLSEFDTKNACCAAIMCTSGTTGTPKGVMLTEKNLLTNILDICRYFNMTQKDKILISRPIYHCAVLSGEFLTGIFKGASIKFSNEKFNPIKIGREIENSNITVFAATPTVFSLLSRLKTDFTALKKIVISGECLDEVTAQKINEKFGNKEIYSVYGLTEASPRVTYLPPEFFKSNFSSVGKPLKSIKIKIIDGMLYIKGENVMKGYYKNPGLTKKVLKKGWLCTGDMAEIDKNGFVKIKGRKDNLIIKAGMNIYPAEIESRLKTDERVKEVLAYGFKSKTGSTDIGLKISGDFSSKDEVKKMCVSLLPEFQIPVKIDILKSLPKNATGKIKRRNSKC